jgi:hypothetical protein
LMYCWGDCFVSRRHSRGNAYFVITRLDHDPMVQGKALLRITGPARPAEFS